MMRILRWVLVIIIILAIYVLFQWVFGDVDTSSSKVIASKSGNGVVCTTAQAQWSAKQKSYPHKALFWIKMPQRVCSKTNTGRQTSIGDPAIYNGITTWGSTLNWHYDGVIGAGFKILSKDTTTEVTRTFRIVRWSQCAGPPGVSIITCVTLRTATLKLRNTFASWPGHIQGLGEPNS